MRLRLSLVSLVIIVTTAACATSSPVKKAFESDAKSAVLQISHENTAPGSGEPEVGAQPCSESTFLGSGDRAMTPSSVAVPCWTALVKVTPDFEAEVNRGKKLGEAHRLVIADLQVTEETACAGLSTSDTLLSPFFHTKDIKSREPIRKDGVTLGARVVFNPIQGLTPERLKAVVTCQLARARKICDPDEVDYCPLVIEEVMVRVNGDTRTGVSIDITSSNPRSVTEILRRLE